MVDFWHDERGDDLGPTAEWLKAMRVIRHVPPMPCVWSGPHRLTKQNWFSVSNARNTALCLAPGPFIAFVDDLSVLLPGWLDAALEARDYIGAGAYSKVKDLVVEDGLVKSFTPYPSGVDSRLGVVKNEVQEIDGGGLFGCSLAGPIEAFLSVNGWPSDLCDSLGFEDCITGIVLQNAGWKIKYDKRMMTYESEELHHVGEVFRKEDWHKNEAGEFVTGGNGKDDKSHSVLNIARQSKNFPNSFGEGGIRELRRRVLAGEPFPIPQSPDREWYSGKLLSEL